LKIVFLTSRLPFPNVDGRKNILLQYIDTIKKLIPNIEIINISFIDDEKYIKDKPDSIDKLLYLNYPSAFEKVFNIILNTFLFRKWPLQVSAFYSRKNYNFVHKILKEEQPDYVFIDMIRMAEYVNGHSYTTIMSYDDLLSLRYKRQKTYIKYLPSILGGFAKKLPKFANIILDMKFIQKIILNYESFITERYEYKIANRYDHLIFTSPKEADEFRKKTGHKSIEGIPMKFRIVEQESQRIFNKDKIVFVGKMDIPHNVAAVKYFCEEIWSIVKKTQPHMKFYIIGRSPIDDVKNLELKFNDVIVTGEVENISKEIKDAAVFVAPMTFGTGIKTKIIEAMAMGIPVVTTENGAEGIMYSNEKNLFVTNHSRQFAEYIRILINREINREVANDAKDLIEQNFSDFIIEKKWENLLLEKEKGEQ